MKELFFKVADNCYEIAFDDEGIAYKQYLPSHGPFCIRRSDVPVDGEGKMDLAFRLNVGEGRADTSKDGLELVGDFDAGDSSYGVYRLPEGGYKMIIVDFAGELACAFTISGMFDKGEATLYGNTTQQIFGLQNCIMVCYAFSCAHRETLLMHSSVPMVGEYAYLFQGKSGTGKSTHCKLWLKYVPGADLLNDDNPAVRFIDGETYVYGTPWSGKTPCYRQMRAKVGAFLRLHQYPENVIRKFRATEAFASIISSSCTMIWDKPSYDAICDTASKICAVTPAFDLNCRPDEEACRLSSETIMRK